MKIDKTLNEILKELTIKHKCHTVILYGSRARGDYTVKSDYDVLGVSKHAKKQIRIAEKVKGKYWDVFIYPEEQLRKIDESHLYMRSGIVLIEKNNFGSKLLKRIALLDKRGPKKLLAWEIQLKKTWLDKTLNRSKQSDPEGNFRRLWLIIGLLEDYFVLRKKWYRGSKESLSWLKTNDTSTYKLFTNILSDPENDSLLKRLTKRVVSQE